MEPYFKYEIEQFFIKEKNNANKRRFRKRENVGLINKGNQCYLNSTLQALFHIPAFNQWLLDDIAYCNICTVFRTCLICSLRELSIQLETRINALYPFKLLYAITNIWPQIKNNDQEDAHEFLRILIDGIEKCYLSRFGSSEWDEKTIRGNPMHQIFGGRETNVICCLNCWNESQTFEDFKDIIVEIDGKETLEECLDGYFAMEDMESSGYKCCKCGSNEVTKTTSLVRSPQVLTIQLLRFGFEGRKLQNLIEISDCVDMTRYLVNPPRQPLKYRLVSAIVHNGLTQYSGHYRAAARNEEGAFNMYNDRFVHRVDTKEVLSSSAYILFLEQIPETNLQNGVSKDDVSNPFWNDWDFE